MDGAVGRARTYDPDHLGGMAPRYGSLAGAVWMRCSNSDGDCDLTRLRRVQQQSNRKRGNSGRFLQSDGDWNIQLRCNHADSYDKTHTGRAVSFRDCAGPIGFRLMHLKSSPESVLNPESAFRYRQSAM